MPPYSDYQRRMGLTNLDTVLLTLLNRKSSLLVLQRQCYYHFSNFFRIFRSRVTSDGITMDDSSQRFDQKLDMNTKALSYGDGGYVTDPRGTASQCK